MSPRPFTRRHLLVAGAAVVLGGGAYGISRLTAREPASEYPGPIVIATGGTKGVYYQYGQAFAAASGGRLGAMELRPTTGSVENLQLLAQGQATFAFVAADAALDAFGGQSPFGTAVPVSAVARLYDDYIHLVVRVDSPVHGLAQLQGLRVSVGPPGSGTALIADRILGASGLDPQHDIVRKGLSINDSVTALAARSIDAFFWSGGLPTTGVSELASSTSLRLVDLGEAAGKLRQLGGLRGASYRTGTIPSRTYPGVEAPVSTVAVPNLLVTMVTTPAGLVYRLAAALFASAGTIGRSIPAAGQLDPRTSIFTEPIPLHEGALAYYRSVKAQM
jgi:TRAP transporter TAXI family solute receptor